MLQMSYIAVDRINAEGNGKRGPGVLFARNDKTS